MRLLYTISLCVGCIWTLGNDARAQTAEQLILADDEKPAPVSATFKSTRIINAHSIENTPQGVLDVRIAHRFGEFSGGGKTFFGLDNATTRLGADYGITNWLTAGLGRSTYHQEFDGFVKLALLRQKTDNSVPLSISYVGMASVISKSALIAASENFSDRLYFANQLLLARKFSNAFSLQLILSHSHYNLVTLADDPNDVFSAGIGGRLKLSNRMALTGEYHANVNPIHGTYNSLSFGLDLETGGHVFQMFVTNSMGITERQFLAGTESSWMREKADGKMTSDIRFGFNISRVFTIVEPKRF